MQAIVSNKELRAIRDAVAKANPNRVIRAWMIADAVKKQTNGLTMHESTIRGRFIEMGEPLSSYDPSKQQPAQPKQEEKKPEPQTQRKSMNDTAQTATLDVPDDLKQYIPTDEHFRDYIERPVDKRLAVHYNLGKHPITQGKQGTGKTLCHMHYAWKNKLPFFLYSCYEDFKLRKIFGDKTIESGTLVFKESLFVKAIQHPSVILFDEVNAISNENTFDFHALLQNRELFVKDADNGNGKLYRLHPDCRIGFAQNPKSAKYIGGNVKPSNFLGRCTYITFPEFTECQLSKAIKKRFTTMQDKDVNNFVKFYQACTETIEKSELPIDVSIRQLNNTIELWLAGMPLFEAIEDGLSSITEAASQPKAKESFHKLAEAVWAELMK